MRIHHLFGGAHARDIGRLLLATRQSAQGAVSAIAAGTFVTFFWDVEVVKQHLPGWLAPRDAIFPALLAALLCLVVVSALTAPPKASQVGLFFPEGQGKADRGAALICLGCTSNSHRIVILSGAPHRLIA